MLYSSHLGLDTKSEPCQRFFREGLTMSFQKILNDDAVHSWKYEIQVQSVKGIYSDYVECSNK